MSDVEMEMEIIKKNKIPIKELQTREMLRKSKINTHIRNEGVKIKWQTNQ